MLLQVMSIGFTSVESVIIKKIAKANRVAYGMIIPVKTTHVM